ncbi:hypothetical protein BH20ACT5_BH20ACT5_25990 [soil metagenome]
MSGQRVRAVGQMLLGVVPVLIVGAALLVVLAVRLAGTGAVLDSASASAQGVVTGTGLGERGREIEVTYTDSSGAEQVGLLTLGGVEEVPLDAQVEIVYDPDNPEVVFAPGDATSSQVGRLITGLLLIGVVMLTCLAITALRWARRRSLLDRPGQSMRASRVKVRRGLSDRSWLTLESGERPVWVPVYWEPVLQTLGEAPTPVTGHGSPGADKLIGFEVAGTPVWPSGRARTEAPAGVPTEGGSRQAEPISLAAQTRADIAPVFFAPVLGLLWAYIDGSGAGSFAVATAMCAALLFWLPSVYGSDPT